MISESKTHFFDLGVAFADFRYSADPDIPYQVDPDIPYQRMRDIASLLQLETPDCNTLKNLHEAPTKWFADPICKPLKNYYRIGNLSFRLFVYSKINKGIAEIPPEHPIISSLKHYCSSEDMPVEILNNYLTHLNDNTLDAFECFKREFYQALENKDSETIFDNLSPDPAPLDKDILRGLHLAITEARKCYKNDCTIATIILCGRVLETLLGSAYEVVFEKNPLPSEDIGFGRMLSQLVHRGIRFPATKELLEFIYAYRSRVIHANIETPSKVQAKCVADLTEEAINLIFDHFAKWDDGITVPEVEETPTKKSPSQVPREARGILRDWKAGYNHAWIMPTSGGQDILIDVDEFKDFLDSLEEGQRLRPGLTLAYDEFVKKRYNDCKTYARNVLIVESEE